MILQDEHGNQLSIKKGESLKLEIHAGKYIKQEQVFFRCFVPSEMPISDGLYEEFTNNSRDKLHINKKSNNHRVILQHEDSHFISMPVFITDNREVYNLPDFVFLIRDLKFRVEEEHTETSNSSLTNETSTESIPSDAISSRNLNFRYAVETGKCPSDVGLENFCEGSSCKQCWKETLQQEEKWIADKLFLELYDEIKNKKEGRKSI